VGLVSLGALDMRGWENFFVNTLGVAWQDSVNAVATAITAASVVVGGGWAYKRFVIEAPQWTRADARVTAALVSSAYDRDVLRVDVSIRAIGSARLKLVRDEARGPVVAVYRFAQSMLDTMEPEEWTDIVVAQRVLPTGQDIVEAGETIGASHLLPLGRRSVDTLAYRVEFTFWAYDPSLKKDFAWVASDYVILAPAGE
jgi:hypothetical protein